MKENNTVNIPNPNLDSIIELTTTVKSIFLSVLSHYGHEGRAPENPQNLFNWPSRHSITPTLSYSIRNKFPTKLIANRTNDHPTKKPEQPGRFRMTTAFARTVN